MEMLTFWKIISFAVVLLINVPEYLSGIIAVPRKVDPCVTPDPVPIFTVDFLGEVLPDNAVAASTTEEPTTTVEPSPIFLAAENENISSHLGDEITLHCIVMHLRSQTVSWLKKHDKGLTLLSTGSQILANDDRWFVRIVNSSISNSTSGAPMDHSSSDVRLHLKPVAIGDQGDYECQISTHPTISKQLHLHVIAPSVEIMDEKGINIVDRFYKKGSVLELKCIVHNIPLNNNKIIWYHEGNEINDSVKTGISVKTEVQFNGALSKIYIAKTTGNDSGLYTCALKDYLSAHVVIHVLEEYQQAVQAGNNIYHESRLEHCI